MLTIEQLPTDASIDNYGYTVFNRWSLGRACFDDGVLLTIALAERKLRIDVGFGLEPAIPDASAAAIIQAAIPLMREQKFGAAASDAFDKLMLAASAKPAARVPGCVDPKRE